MRITRCWRAARLRTAIDPTAPQSELPLGGNMQLIWNSEVEFPLIKRLALQLRSQAAALPDLPKHLARRATLSSNRRGICRETAEPAQTTRRSHVECRPVARQHKVLEQQFVCAHRCSALGLCLPHLLQAQRSPKPAQRDRIEPTDRSRQETRQLACPDRGDIEGVLQ